MMRHFTLALTFAGLMQAVSILQAEIPRKDPPPGDTLQAVLDRIREHAASDAWKQPGWTDEKIEAWLDKLVGSVAKGADIPDLKLPVRLAEVKASDPNQQRVVSGLLVVGRNVELGNVPLRNSIVLSDGNVEIGGVDNCVVVARGVIRIRASSERSVIVAGVHAMVGRDASRGRGQAGSLIVSRGWANLGETAMGTIVAAHEGIFTGRSLTDVTFVNAPVPPLRRGFVAERGSRSVTVPDLPLEKLPVHPLAAKLKLKGVLHSQRQQSGRLLGVVEVAFGPVGIVFDLDGRRVVADSGTPIVDEAGKAVPQLVGWKLTEVIDPFALLSNSGSDVVLRLDRQ